MTEATNLALPVRRAGDARLIGGVSAAHFASHFYLLTLPPLFVFVKAEYDVTYTRLGLTLTMTTFEPAARPASALRLAPALYAATMFLSALLLFLMQPMFAKMVLPRLGGAPTVWSVAMVFFQAALLTGYAYAHWLTRSLPLGPGALIHIGMRTAGYR